jgi:hypothetical protein
MKNIKDFTTFVNENNTPAMNEHHCETKEEKIKFICKKDKECKKADLEKMSDKEIDKLYKKCEEECKEPVKENVITETFEKPEETFGTSDEIVQEEKLDIVQSYKQLIVDCVNSDEDAEIVFDKIKDFTNKDNIFDKSFLEGLEDDVKKDIFKIVKITMNYFKPSKPEVKLSKEEALKELAEIKFE